MQTQELITRFAPRAAELGIDLNANYLERLREERSGRFGAQTFRRTRHWAQAYESILAREERKHANRQLAARIAEQEANRLEREPTSDLEWARNLVTNEGLAHVLSIVLDAGSQITTWYLTLSSSNTSASATMTAATPVFTEIDATDVTETIRQTWSGGSVTGTTTASIDNSAAPATYTCDTAGFTAWAAALIGGGTSAFGNTAGTLYSYSLFASEKAMASTDTIDVTYTFTATDA